MSPIRLTGLLCTAEVLWMAGFATFPALLPTFMDDWGLSNTQAGWVSGILYGGYVVGVPVLTALTDRVDARRILLVAAFLGGFSVLGFGLLAEGFRSAMLFRFLTGLGLAGAYMPGLKVLSDRIEGPRQSRHVSFYTSSFGLGASISYLVAGELARALDWRWAFGLSSAAYLLSALVIFAWIPSTVPRPSEERPRMLLDFRPVLRARQAMGYILGYAAHTWELFGVRSWIVAFLTFSAGFRASGTLGWSATQLAALLNLLGLPASIGGNELAGRYGRRRTLYAVMAVSLLASLSVGFSAKAPAVWVLAVCLVHNTLVMADSAALTAGAVAAAPLGQRGATLALHSTLGFGSGFVGPLAVGLVLDGFGASVLGWGMAFAVMGMGNLAGIAALFLLRGTRGRPGRAANGD